MRQTACRRPLCFNCTCSNRTLCALCIAQAKTKLLCTTGPFIGQPSGGCCHEAHYIALFEQMARLPSFLRRVRKARRFAFLCANCACSVSACFVGTFCWVRCIERLVVASFFPFLLLSALAALVPWPFVRSFFSGTFLHLGSGSHPPHRGCQDSAPGLHCHAAVGTLFQWPQEVPVACKRRGLQRGPCFSGSFRDAPCRFSPDVFSFSRNNPL